MAPAAATVTTATLASAPCRSLGHRKTTHADQNGDQDCANSHATRVGARGLSSQSACQIFRLVVDLAFLVFFSLGFLSLVALNFFGFLP